MTTGALIIRVKAAMLLHWGEGSSKMPETAMARVTSCPRLTHSQPRANSLWPTRKAIRAAIAIAGSANGTLMRQNATQAEAPSRNADSSNSLGAALKAARMFHTQNGIEKAV